MLVEDGCLPEETDPALYGIDLTGFNDNYWVGLSLLHTLFVKEHNAICDFLRAHYPTWDDEQLFLTARLSTGADGEDPHRRVDAGHPRHAGAAHRDARQLVRRAPAWAKKPSAAHRRARGALRRRRRASRSTTPRRTRSPRSSPRSTGCTR